MTLKPHHLLWLGLWGSLGWILVELTASTPKTSQPAQSDIIAWVDDVPISTQRYFAVLASVAAQKEGPPVDAKVRRMVLDDLIAEELLLSRAVALELPRNAALARRHLVSAMTQLAQTQPLAPPDESELRAYFQQNRTRFRARRQVAVSRMVFKDAKPDMEKRAQHAVGRLAAGEDFQHLTEALSDAPIVPLPKGLMPSSTLRHYVGPKAAQVATELAVGEISDILPMAGGLQLLKVMASAESPEPDYEQVASSVLTLFERDAKAEQLRQYVQALKLKADIRVNEHLVEHVPIPKEALSQARTPLWDAGPRAIP